jgi:hypothetical protein
MKLEGHVMKKLKLAEIPRIRKDESADLVESLMKNPDPKFWAESFLEINDDINVNKYSKNDLKVMIMWFDTAFKCAVGNKNEN